MSVSCPACGKSVTSPVCSWCHAAIGDDGLVIHPKIRALEPVISIDHGTEPWVGLSRRKTRMGSVRVSPVDGGVKVRCRAGQSIVSLCEAVRMRDTAVSTTLKALDDGVVAGLVFRHERIGDGDVHLVFDVSPARRSVRLARRALLADRRTLHELVPWTVCEAVAPVGECNLLQVVAVGASIQGWVNGVSVLQEHVPTFGIGHCGARVSAHGRRKPQAAVFAWWQVATAGPGVFETTAEDA